MFVFFLTFGFVSARFVPYAEFNMYPDPESAIKLRAEMDGDIIIGRAQLNGNSNYVSGEATIDFKLGQDLPGFISFYDELESVGVNCTWEKLDTQVMMHLYQKAQDIMDQNFGEPKDFVAYMETNTYGRRVDGMQCMVTTEV